MKRKLSYIASFCLISLLSIAAIEVSEACDFTALKKELKNELKPDFKYDSSKITRFTYKGKTQQKETEVPLFMGEKYKFLFNTSCLPVDVKVEVYSKPIGHKKRTLLYQLEKKEGQHIYAYEPEKSRKMYISYTIPKTDKQELKGSLVFILGYRIGGIKKDK